MCRRRCILGLALLILFGVAPANLGASGSGDFDGNGYLDQSDYFIFAICFSLSGPSEYPGFQECVEVFDRDADGDVDLADYAGFSMSLGHLPMPLKDRLGRPITIDSTEPYSPNRTCGECHEHFVEAISNGEWFQQGRTDLDGNVDMRDDYEGDGRYWIKSAGRYGKWGQSFQFMLAAKENAHPSQIDQTAFAWVRDCSGCHSGGGPGEFDRDDQLFYNEATGAFGYEASGKTSEDVVLDGDYTVLNWSTGSLDPAPWDVTGVSEPDCLLCHRDRRPTVDGVDMVRAWRASTLAAGANLVDSQGKPVPAFAAASTAGQGWFAGASSAATNAGTKGKGQLPLADRAFLDEPHLDRSNVASEPTLQIDYSVGVADGSLVVNEKNEVLLTRDAVAQRTLDRACVDCHPLAVVAGEVWFDDRDIHYRKFNNLNDEDPNNDIPPDRSTVCTECHPTGLDHNAAKGNSFQLQYRNELDYVNFRTCRDCHLTHLPNGEPNPLKHPESIDVPGDTPIHQIGFAEGENGPMRVMSCQACHIPYALTPGLFFRDITIPGNLAWTSQYLSSDPLNPGDSDKTRWYPPLLWKTDTDGVRRLFPASVWINIYFGDWDQKGTPDDLSDDVIAPIYTWRVAQAVGTTALPIVTDDDGDGRLEIDRPEEIVVYLKALRQNDVHGEPVARNPVLVRGPRVWYFDPQTETGVNHYYHEDKGIPMTSYPYIWGMDHNVRPAEEAWGAGDEPEACNTCHRNDGKSPVFDRKVLVDPHGLDGKPEYTTVKEMVKVYPFHSRIILKDYLGEPLTLDSTRPYSGRQTCGGVRCHDIDLISNGLVFQEG
ncbi:MAG: EF-hand domain-containing protein, partial [Phycisphaerae bacterium]